MDPNESFTTNLARIRDASIDFDNTLAFPITSFRLQHRFLDQVYNSHPDLEDLSAKRLDQISQNVGLSMKEILLWYEDEKVRRARLQASSQTDPFSRSFSRTPVSVTDSERNSSRTFTIASSSVSSTDEFALLRDRASWLSPTPGPTTSQAVPGLKRRGRPPKIVYNNTPNTPLISSRAYKRQKFSSVYPCVDCKKTFPAERWPEHIRRVHFPDFVWECPKANCLASFKPFFRPDNFATHLRGEHDYLPLEISILKETCRFEVVDFFHKICGICDEILSSRDESIDHIKDHFKSISLRIDPPVDLGISEWREKCGYEHVLRRGVHYRLELGAVKEECKQDNQYDEGNFGKGSFIDGFTVSWPNQQGSGGSGGAGYGSSHNTGFHPSQDFEFMDFEQYACNNEHNSACKGATETAHHDLSRASPTQSPDAKHAATPTGSDTATDTDTVVDYRREMWRPIEPMVATAFDPEFAPLWNSLGSPDFGDAADKQPLPIPEIRFDFSSMDHFVDPSILHPAYVSPVNRLNGPKLGSRFTHDSSTVSMGLSVGSPRRYRIGSQSPYPFSIISTPGYPASTRPSISSHSFVSDESRDKARCSYPGCHKVFKDLKAHVLTHQIERPEKCPVETCEFHTKGFARKYDKNRHTLTHYKGTMVCGFCPGSDTAAEKSFNRADVFKRHLVSVHSVELTPPNSRKNSPPSAAAKGPAPGTTGICSNCAVAFVSAQQFYEHLDNCVLKVMQLETNEPTNETGENQSAENGNGTKPAAPSSGEYELHNLTSTSQTRDDGKVPKPGQGQGEGEEEKREEREHHDETRTGVVTRSRSGLS